MINIYTLQDFDNAKRLSPGAAKNHSVYMESYNLFVSTNKIGGFVVYPNAIASKLLAGHKNPHSSGVWHFAAMGANAAYADLGLIVSDNGVITGIQSQVADILDADTRQDLMVAMLQQIREKSVSEDGERYLLEDFAKVLSGFMTSDQLSKAFNEFANCADSQLTSEKLTNV